MNNLVIVGRISTDIDVTEAKTYTRSNFVVADNQFKEAQFIQCVSFDKNFIKNFSKVCKKGDLVSLTGNLQIIKFQGNTYPQLKAITFQLLSKKFVKEYKEQEEQEEQDEHEIGY